MSDCQKEIQMNRFFFRCALVLWALIARVERTPVFAQPASMRTPAALSGIAASAGPYHVEAATEPAIVPVGAAKLRVKIKDAAGNPIAGATVKTFVTMPGMSMGERETIAQPQPNEPGVYVAPAAFPMAGGYRADIKITGPQGPAQISLTLSTGQNTVSNGGRSPLAFVLWIAGVLGFAFVLYRVWRSGQKPNWKNFLNRQVLGGLLLIAVIAIIAIYAVRKWRRPGAMTPIEAQAMEMNMPAPPGTLPVQLVTVKRGALSSRVRYTGQAVGYIEQEVYPRASGVIEWMPLYPGDRVQKNQLLARLDTTQSTPQVAQSEAAARMANEGTSVARMEYQAALADVRQSEGELGIKRGAVEEAQSGVQRAEAAASTQLAMLAEARSGERKARAEVKAKLSAIAEARSQQRKARAMLKETQTDVRGARGAAAETQSDLVAVREESADAQAAATAAHTQIADAEAQLEAARADQEYWQKEIARMQVLVKAGAVSREEFQREQAQAENAAAKVRQAMARASQVQAEVKGAEARARRADALIQSAQAKADQASAKQEGNAARIEQAQADIISAAAKARQMTDEASAARADISAASDRVQQRIGDVRGAYAEISAAHARVRQAEAELEAHHAHVMQTRAAASAMRARITQAQAGADQARAGLSAAEVARGYSAIRSQLDGVVTQRLISPGILVQPGQAILRVAQIEPMRLQANVAESDLEKLRVGASVIVRSRDDAKKMTIARLTSVAPSVDPQSRTGIVEAIVPNSNHWFLPGQYVVMEISTGQNASALQIPSRAIQWQSQTTSRVLAGQSQPFVWVAEAVAGQAGHFTARRVAVHIGLSNAENTEVISGLKENQRVVTDGQTNLQDGATVAVPEPESVSDAPPAMKKMGAMKEQSASVSITESGYVPSTLSLHAGVPARITFTRKTDATCGTEIVFPDYSITKKLPLNEPVIIEFTPKKSGEINFTCGMKMLKGKVIVR